MSLLERVVDDDLAGGGVAVAERPADPPAPAVTGVHPFADALVHPDEDSALLESLDRQGRLVTYIASAVGALAIVAIGLLVLPMPGFGDDGATILAQDLQITEVITTTSTSVPTSTTQATLPGKGPSEVLVGLSAMITDLPDQTTTTAAVGWVEPEIEPESQWTDGGNGVLLPDVLLRIRFCESTNNYGAAHVASSARGAYQFLTMSWEWYGHAERYGVAAANLATPAQQDEAALLTYQQDGARPWAESRSCWDDPDIDSRYLTARPRATTTTAPPATTTTTADSTSTTGATTTSTTAATTTSTTAASSTTSSTTTSSTTTPSSTSSSSTAPSS